MCSSRVTKRRLGDWPNTVRETFFLVQNGMSCQLPKLFVAKHRILFCCLLLSDRAPSKLIVPRGSGKGSGKPPGNQKLTVIGGDIRNKEDIAKVFAGQQIDGVIVALGGKDADLGEGLFSDETQIVIAVMKEKGIKRLAVVTSMYDEAMNGSTLGLKLLSWKQVMNQDQQKRAAETGMEYMIAMVC